MCDTPSTPGPSGQQQLGSSVKKDTLTRLMELQLEELDSVTKKIDLWKKYKGDYQDLKQLINKMQDKVRHPYRVPIAGTKMAYADGHIIHTNEFHVLLGYNYFALRSAKQATQIIDRRLNDLKGHLSLEEEARKKTENWFQATQEHKRDKEEFVEIIETM